MCNPAAAVCNATPKPAEGVLRYLSLVIIVIAQDVEAGQCLVNILVNACVLCVILHSVAVLVNIRVPLQSYVPPLDYAAHFESCALYQA